MKDPDGRFQTARDLKYNLSLALEATPTIASARAYWRSPWIVAVVIGLLAIAIFVLRRPLPATEKVWRFQIPVAGSARLSAYGSFAISPDGRQLAYFASTPDGVSRLLLRSRDSLEARPLPGTESRPSRSTGAPRPPFWSPDSRFIAYGYQGKLKKIDIMGGTPQVVCDIPDAATGGSWNRKNVIIFANNNGGIMSVPVVGGTPSVVSVRDSSRSERPPTFPAFLADGRHFLYLRANAGHDLAPALFLRWASDSFSLTRPNTSCKIEWPASLRSEGVRVHPGMPFGFPSETTSERAIALRIARGSRSLSHRNR
jgi:hypothetical protein